MVPNKRSRWMIMPATFVKLIGGDYTLLVRCDSGVLKKHYLAASTLVLITILSLLSIWYAVELLFHSLPAEIGLSLFVALLFGCIYIFILNTFSKSVQTKTSRLINASNIIRIGFIVFMALMISKPIETFFYKNKVAHSVAGYKASLLKHYEESLNILYADEIKKLELRKAQLADQNRAFYTAGSEVEIDQISSTLREIEDRNQGDIAMAKRRIDSSDYLLYRIQKVATYLPAWLISLAITAMFLIPGFIIYSISSDDQYYSLKKEREYRMITSNYEGFLLRYTEIFREKWTIDTQFYSAFSDPPFNSTKIEKPQCLEPADFLLKYLVQ